ncbi:hypothetical protein EDC01DRAFT_776382 [Geopyxis carbonaria]|nr:hypothetical protein EDC01DRAFT_776382 [Geopyxis carbonaria]
MSTPNLPSFVFATASPVKDPSSPAKDNAANLVLTLACDAAVSKVTTTPAVNAVLACAAGSPLKETQTQAQAIDTASDPTDDLVLALACDIPAVAVTAISMPNPTPTATTVVAPSAVLTRAPARASKRLASRASGSGFAAVPATTRTAAAPVKKKKVSSATRVTKPAGRKPAARKTAATQKSAIANNTAGATAVARRRVRAPVVATAASGRERRAVKGIDRYGLWAQ